MKIIEKKIDLLYLRDIILGIKTFEIRKEDDIHYDVDDIIVLRAYDKNTNKYIKYEYALVQITSVLRKYEGLKDGYVILSIKLLNNIN